MRTILLGIDPGASGALAFVDPMGAFIEDMPDSPAALADLLRHRHLDIRHAFIEKQWARPGMGVSAMFKLGMGYGIIQGVISSFLIPISLVSPVDWKKHHHLIDKDKNESRLRASMLFPELAGNLGRKKDHGRAEALLIAAYGATLAYHNKKEAA